MTPPSAQPFYKTPPERAPGKYAAYGLVIRSEAGLPLPELSPGSGRTDVAVRFGSVDRSPTTMSPSGCRLRIGVEEVCLVWREAGAFLVREGREIIVDPDPGVDPRALRLFILGPVMAALLHQRGLLVLHASTVTAGGSAIIFMGGAGWGKSTLATALYTRGHGVVSDDVTAVRIDGKSPVVLPGFPQIKLRPDSAASLLNGFEALPRVHPRIDKRALNAALRFSGSPLRPERIYVLAEGARHEIEPLRPEEALVELVRHSYLARLLKATRTDALHFLQCASLADQVPIRRLKRRRSLPALPALAGLVEEDLARTDV